VKSCEYFRADNISLETSFYWLSGDIVRFKIEVGVECDISYLWRVSRSFCICRGSGLGWKVAERDSDELTFNATIFDPQVDFERSVAGGRTWEGVVVDSDVTSASTGAERLHFSQHVQTATDRIALLRVLRHAPSCTDNVLILMLIRTTDVLDRSTSYNN